MVRMRYDSTKANFYTFFSFSTLLHLRSIIRMHQPPASHPHNQTHTHTHTLFLHHTLLHNDLPRRYTHSPTPFSITIPIISRSLVLILYPNIINTLFPQKGVSTSSLYYGVIYYYWGQQVSRTCYQLQLIWGFEKVKKKMLIKKSFAVLWLANHSSGEMFSKRLLAMYRK